MIDGHAAAARRIMRQVVQRLVDHGCSDAEIAAAAPGLWKQIGGYVRTGRWDATWH